MKSVPARAIQELAGHADFSKAQRYMHLSPAATEDAIRLLDGPAEAGRHDCHADLDEKLGDILSRDRWRREVLAQERSWLASRSS
jgi:hypothetical protein